jgi:hypothetical protein
VYLKKYYRLLEAMPKFLSSFIQGMGHLILK